MHHPPVVHLLLSMRIINACPEHRACSGLHERTASTRIAAPGGVVVILLYIIIVCCANGRQQSAQHRCDDCRGFAVDCLLQILLNHRMRDGHASQRFQRHLQPLHSLQYCSFNATYARTHTRNNNNNKSGVLVLCCCCHTSPTLWNVASLARGSNATTSATYAVSPVIAKCAHATSISCIDVSMPCCLGSVGTGELLRASTYCTNSCGALSRLHNDGHHTVSQSANQPLLMARHTFVD
jgi:hypothetical protein